MIRLSSVSLLAVEVFPSREQPTEGNQRERGMLMSSGQLQYSPRYGRSSPSTLQDVRIRTYQFSVSCPETSVADT